MAAAAFETEATIALAVGNRRRYTTSRIVSPGTSIDGRAAAILHPGRKAEGADHVAAVRTLLIYIANVLLACGAGVAELQTDAVAMLDVAFAVSESVIDETVRRSAQGIALFLANYEWCFSARFGAIGERRADGKELDERQNRRSFVYQANHDPPANIRKSKPDVESSTRLG